MRTITLLIVLLCCSVSAWANDAVIVGVGGTLQPLKGEHRTIRMVREHVRMVVPPEYSYRVTADFVFHNDGPATTVMMGFPESGGGDIDPERYKNRSGFKSFATWVDGHRTRARYVAAPGEHSGYLAHWVKRVRFARGQTRRVRVRYSSKSGGFSTGANFIGYEFTGGNWRGEVEESVLTVTFQVPGRNSGSTRFNYRKPTGRGSMVQHQKGNRFFYRWRHWQAEGDYMLDYLPLVPNNLAVNYEKSTPKTYPGDFLIELPYNRTTGICSAMPGDPAAMHAGMPVMALHDLKKWLDRQDKHSKQVQPTKIEWNNATKSASLHTGSHVFELRVGKPYMLIDGKRHRLPAPPLLLGYRGFYSLYAPLEPIIETLGGKVKVVPKERRVWFHL